MMAEVVPGTEHASNVEHEPRRGDRRRTHNARNTKDDISLAISPLVKRIATTKR